MTRDPLDDLGARLFEAARNETAPQGAEQRALLAAEEEARTARVTALPRKTVWAAAATLCALAAGVALFMQRKEAPEPISAEPASAHTATKPAPRVAESAASSGPVKPAPVPTPSSVRPQVSAPLPSASASVDLSGELAALKVASSALAAGDTAAALAALDRYDHVLKGSKLRAEATLLRIQALARAGNAQAASALAQRFVEQNPDSPLVDRARSFIQESSGGN